MNNIIRIVLYVVFGVGTLVFSKYFFRDYQRANPSRIPISQSEDPMDVEVPSYHFGQNQNENQSSPDASSETNAIDENAIDENAIDDSSSNADHDFGSFPPPRPVFYGAWFCLSIISLGLLAAFDISQFIGKGTIGTLFNDDGDSVIDGDYEVAEAQWQQGDYLEAIRLLREYLTNHPKEIHAALRIAEIYEKDLNHPLAAALEYEEILQKRLPRERWGWAAIHLANLYSGPLEKPDRALALLRRLDREYGETQAAQKARERLAMIEDDPSEEA